VAQNTQHLSIVFVAAMPLVQVPNGALSTAPRSEARFEEGSSAGKVAVVTVPETQETQLVDKQQQSMLLNPKGHALATVMRDEQGKEKEDHTTTMSPHSFVPWSSWGCILLMSPCN